MTGGDNNKSKSIPIVCLLVSWLLFNHANKLLMKKAHQVKESAVYVECRVFFFKILSFRAVLRTAMASSCIEPSAFAGLKGLWHEICYLRFFMKKFHQASTIPLGIFFRKIPKILATEGCSPVSMTPPGENCWKVPTTQANTVERCHANDTHSEKYHQFCCEFFVKIRNGHALMHGET